ncbi:hypothetical protein KTT_53220 [Tengunoibacter tsumagoiensis]|uniref:Mycothiol-dependent maleylpyruvate isomerase metal-binding domain-containing protein n=1 Tax=Tengunoibacter tsumagoiensis TaxID=2014871 RepID=A0A402A8J9_9CHLR|nr:maleylpyruvate isomerase N-terminal domain-containing protein [Tengunoibacter tsumagoiensis]GCE15463.1 hypothetical protein KTT_53220 [Tengunoibacter tsumagoiensis]
MDTILSKTQLLTELHNENAYWQALLDEIGEVNMTQPEVAGGWSIKDIVAHLTGWRRWSVKRFQFELNHEPDFTPPWPPALQSDDDINAWIYASQRDRPLADVLSDSHEVWQQLVEVLDHCDATAPEGGDGEQEPDQALVLRVSHRNGLTLTILRPCVNEDLKQPPSTTILV